MGALAGVLGVSAIMPIQTYKFCIQSGRALPTALPEFYRGLPVQAAAVAPIAAVQMVAYGTLQKVISGASPFSAKLKRELTTAEELLASLGAGLVCATILSPVDLLTIQQQRLGLDLMDCFNYILQVPHAPVETPALSGSSA